MAKNGKNRLAILTIFRFRRTDVILVLYFYSDINPKENGGAKRRHSLLGLYSAFFSLRKSPRKFLQDSFSPLQAKFQTL